ncbi:MAG: energy-coupling factor transporter transmembrane component T [Bacillota bacterium]|nr:energy-coupling factor transporter transmembrane component T [Bacillota bacterium]
MLRNNEFGSYHPAVNFIYFIFVTGFSMFVMHPVCMAVSFACGSAYSIMLNGKSAAGKNFLYMLPVMAGAALINPLFNHEGMTILGYFPGGNPLTLESVIYGLAAALMLVTVICWFSCCSRIMTGDKYIYLFGRAIPALSLILSMTLRFVPKFLSHLKEVTEAQKCVGRDISSGSLVRRAKNGLAILSIMTTWALENAVETADSMKSRGYGLPGRTSFSIYTFEGRDKAALAFILTAGLYVLAGIINGRLSFLYFPSIGGEAVTPYIISLFAAYSGLCVCPIIIEIRENRRWNAIKSKI